MCLKIPCSHLLSVRYMYGVCGICSIAYNMCVYVASRWTCARTREPRGSIGDDVAFQCPFRDQFILNVEWFEGRVIAPSQHNGV